MQCAQDASFEALVARIVADYAVDHDAGREAAWIAEVDGRRAGCSVLRGGRRVDHQVAAPAGTS
ncbi:MAG: hypothetical protein WKF83_08590 [Nocardioidaceae bacterium]